MGVEKEGILMLYAVRVAGIHRSASMQERMKGHYRTVVCSCTDISASFASHFIDTFPHQTMNEVGRKCCLMSSDVG